MDLGGWEGRNWDEIRETEAERHHIWDTHRRFCHTPGGECYNEVLRRTLAALEQILAREKDDVLVVTHSAVLMALRCYLANRPFDVMREYRTRNTELVWVTEEEIRAYVASKEPMDKAGAYGIQGLFAAYVSGIEGDYNNVVGLPIARIYQELKQLGIDVYKFS